MMALVVMVSWTALLVGYAVVLSRSTHPEH
jgi:hypothetical protein